MQVAIRPQDSVFTSLPEFLRLLAACGVVRSYPKKAVLINEGEQSDRLFVLVKGSVKVF